MDKTTYTMLHNDTNQIFSLKLVADNCNHTIEFECNGQPLYSLWWLCWFDMIKIVRQISEDDEINIKDIILMNTIYQLQILDWPKVNKDFTDEEKQKSVNYITSWFNRHNHLNSKIIPKFTVEDFQFLWDYLRI